MRAIVLLLAAGVAAAETHLVEGNPSSTVRVVVYEDLQCPDCAVFRRMMDEHLLPRFKDKAAFEHRDFPLAKHAWARRAAIVARHFEIVKKETAIEFRRWIMSRIREINPDNFNEKIASFAKEHGADPAKVLASLTDAKLAEAVERDFQEGVARGIARTPTVLVDGEPFIERFPLEEITAAIERAVSAASKTPASKK